MVAAGGAISRVLAALRLGGGAGVKWRVSGGCDGGVVGGGGHGGGDGGGGVVAGEGVVGDGLRLQTNATRPSQRHGKNKFQCFRYSTSLEKPKDQYLPLDKHHVMHWLESYTSFHWQSADCLAGISNEQEAKAALSAKKNV